MRSVLISIRPKWCELIASGEKTIEVRKTRPKIETPFKCYIYCTDAYCSPDGDAFSHGWRKRVIGEFTCDKIGEAQSNLNWMQDFGYAGCLTNLQMFDYIGENDILFGWHISELKIYDTPKKLGEFHRLCVPSCNFSEECGGVQDGEHCLFPMKRPPQSWCYVEELK